MQVELFTLCDGAYNYDGRLTIVGTFDTIKESRVPFRKSLSIAAILKREAAEREAKELAIGIVDGEGMPVMPAIKMQISFPSDVAQTKLVIAMKLDNVSFKGYGAHKLVMTDNGVEIFSYGFNVSQ